MSYRGDFPGGDDEEEGIALLALSDTQSPPHPHPRHRSPSFASARPIPTSPLPAQSLRLPTKRVAIVVLLLLSGTFLLFWSKCLSFEERNPNTGYLTNKQILLRSGKSTSSDSIGHISAGTELTVDDITWDDKSSKKIHVLSPQEGWASEQITQNGKKARLVLRQEAVPVTGSCTISTHLPYAPGILVFAQQLWNGAQVVFVLLLLMLVGTTGGREKNLFGAISACIVVLLPYSHYYTSQGAFVFAFVAGVVSIYVAAPATEIPDAVLSIEKPGDSVRGYGIAKLETLGFLCNLGSSMYNYYSESRNGLLGTGVFPWWNSIFEFLGEKLVVTTSRSDWYEMLYGFWGGGLDKPSFIPGANYGSTLGNLQFFLWWGFLPTLYCLYYVSMGISTKNYFQRFLVLFCIWHFLFWTDMVDYKYGRGMKYETAEFYHWAERWAWRIATVLPVYQKCRSGDFLEGFEKKWVGRIVHTAVGFWGLAFFIYQVLACDTRNFYYFLMETPTTTRPFGMEYIHELGYHGALVVGFVFYGWCRNNKKCKVLCVSAAAHEMN